MARKSGYEVLEVDEFVDEVEESFAQLIEENQNLKKQVEALKVAAPPAARRWLPTARRSASRQPSAAAAGEPPRPAAASAPSTIVVTTGKEASSAVVRLVEMSTEQAERLVEEATEDANRIREEANRTAHQLTTDARTRAERVESEARVNAERLQADALESRREAGSGDRELGVARCSATWSGSATSSPRPSPSLRNFETAYRTNLTSHLRSQIETLESGRRRAGRDPGRRTRAQAGRGHATATASPGRATAMAPAEREEATTARRGQSDQQHPPPGRAAGRSALSPHHA